MQSHKEQSIDKTLDQENQIDGESCICQYFIKNTTLEFKCNYRRRTGSKEILGLVGSNKKNNHARIDSLLIVVFTPPFIPKREKVGGIREMKRHF